MGQWKGDSNPGGPGGSTRRIPAKGSGRHRKKDSVFSCAVIALLMLGVVELVVVAAVLEVLG